MAEQSTPFEGVLLILRKLDEVDQRLVSLEQGVGALVPFLTRVADALQALKAAPTVPVASYADLYGAEAEEEPSAVDTEESTPSPPEERLGHGRLFRMVMPKRRKA